MTEHEQMIENIANNLQRLESQIADQLGELEAVTKENPDLRIQAVGQKLRHMEMRRWHEVQHELNLKHQVNTTEALREVAGALRDAVDRLVGPPADHTVIKVRGLGMQIYASGRESDPVFADAAKAVEQLTIKLTELREDVVRHDMTTQDIDRGNGEDDN